MDSSVEDRRINGGRVGVGEFKGVVAGAPPRPVRVAEHAAARQPVAQREDPRVRTAAVGDARLVAHEPRAGDRFQPRRLLDVETEGEGRLGRGLGQPVGRIQLTDRRAGGEELGRVLTPDVVVAPPTETPTMPLARACVASYCIRPSESSRAW